MELTAARCVDIVYQGAAVLCRGRVWEDAFQAGREKSVRMVGVTTPHRGS